MFRIMGSIVKVRCLVFLNSPIAVFHFELFESKPSRRFSSPSEHATSSDTAQPAGNALSECWGPSKIFSIEVDDILFEPSVQFIADPNFGTYMIAFGGQTDCDCVLASSLRQESFDTFVGPLHMKGGIVKLRVKIAFLHEFQVTLFQIYLIPVPILFYEFKPN